jgi:uncharacterized protein
MLSALLSLLLVTAAALTPGQVANPRQHGGWITDAAGLLPAGAQASIDQRLSRLERDLGVEIAVVTVNEVAGSPKDFATALFKRWRIGKAGLDNGLLVLLVQRSRRIEMETGYGLEASLPDAYLGQLQISEMVPRLRRRDVAGALEAALTNIDERLRAERLVAPPGSPPLPVLEAPQETPQETPEEKSSRLNRLILLMVVGVPPLWLLVALLLRRRRRVCPSCRGRLRLVSDGSELQHLSATDQLEMRLASAHHTIYRCTRCSEIRHMREERFFSPYGCCPQCQVRALNRIRRTFQVATEVMGGVDEIDERCLHCQYAGLRLEHTPCLPGRAAVIVSSMGTSLTSHSGSSFSSDSGSSFSSDSGGSFGGGDSGGGGAGSSW